MVEFKRLSDVEAVAEPIESANVLIEENGVIKKAPKAAVGGGAGVTSWNDLTDKPFYETGEFIWNGYLSGSKKLHAEDIGYTFEVGETYTIECDNYDLPGQYTIEEKDGEPFCEKNFEGEFLRLTGSSVETNTHIGYITIYKGVREMKKIDMKYLPMSKMSGISGLYPEDGDTVTAETVNDVLRRLLNALQECGYMEIPGE